MYCCHYCSLELIAQASLLSWKQIPSVIGRRLANDPLAEPLHPSDPKQDPCTTRKTNIEGRYNPTRILFFASGFARSSLPFVKRGVNEIASFPVGPPSLTRNDQAHETYPHTGISMRFLLSSNSDHVSNDLRDMAFFVDKQHQTHSKATSHNCYIAPEKHLAILWSCT